MLTKVDDYPIHQTPEPIAYTGGVRNFYHRYFFNGVQHNVIASRVLNTERMDSQVGPVAVEVVGAHAPSGFTQTMDMAK